MIKETPEMTETVVEQEPVEKPAVTPVPAASDEQLVAMLVDQARYPNDATRIAAPRASVLPPRRRSCAQTIRNTAPPSAYAGQRREIWEICVTCNRVESEDRPGGR